jgi:hypothetical protein
MPIVEKNKKPAVPDTPPAVVPAAVVDADVSIEKPKAKKPPTEAMKAAGKANLEKGRLALQAKRDAAKAAKGDVPAVAPPVAPAVVPAAAPPKKTKKVIYQEESDSDNEVVIIKKKKKAPRKVIYQEDSDDEPVVVKKKAPVSEVPAAPQYIQPMTVLRWI